MSPEIIGKIIKRLVEKVATLKSFCGTSASTALYLVLKHLMLVVFFQLRWQAINIYRYRFNRVALFHCTYSCKQ